MTEREKWEAGLWYDANFDPELCAEREKSRGTLYRVQSDPPF